jgi:hypothetical protein
MIFYPEPDGGVRAGEALGVDLLILILLEDFPMTFLFFFWGVGLVVTFHLPTWVLVDISYAAPQNHEIVNVALHREHSPGIIFIFS